MKALKTIVAVGIVAALGMGLTACGGAASAYSGEGTVVSKEIDKDKKTKKTSNNKKKTTTTTEYEVMVDVPNSDVDQEFDVTKSKYDMIQVGQKVMIQGGQIL